MSHVVSAQTNTTDPVTVVVNRIIKQDTHNEFEAWQHGITQDISRYAGFLGMDVIRPSDRTNPEYVIVFRFDSEDHFRQWERSHIRAEWMRKVEPITHNVNMKSLSGLEFWFDPPSASQSSGRAASPRRYKMAVVTWIAITTILVLLMPPLNSVFSFLPRVPRTMVTSAFVVLLMTYAAMPLAIRVFKGWLYPNK